MLKEHRAGFSPILALVLLLMVGVGSVAAIKVISERPLPPADLRAAGGIKLSPAPSAKTGPASAKSEKESDKKANLASDRTVWVVARPRADRHAIIIEFTAAGFSNVESIKYDLVYESGTEVVKRGIQGTITPEAVNGKNAAGQPYIKRELVFGSCSAGACVYEVNPRNFKLKVQTKLVKGGTENISTTLAL